MERLIRLSNTDADLVDGEHQDLNVNGYNILWTVTTPAGGANFKNIKLTVKWKERGMQKQMVFDYVKPGT